MARKPRDQRPGFHHVVTRGNNKRTIFVTDADRLSFMALLDTVATRHNWDILAYCLMRNHYHLVIRIRDGLAEGMRELNGIYALYFNAEHGRINHLFGRRYWSEFTATDGHLLNAIRYVLQNPRRAGVPGPLESHPWTSYRPAIGTAFGPKRFARNELLGLFGSDPLRARNEFVAFCNEPAPPPPANTRCQAPAQKVRVRVT